MIWGTATAAQGVLSGLDKTWSVMKYVIIPIVHMIMEHVVRERQVASGTTWLTEVEISHATTQIAITMA